MRLLSQSRFYHAQSAPDPKQTHPPPRHGLLFQKRVSIKRSYVFHTEDLQKTTRPTSGRDFGRAASASAPNGRSESDSESSVTCLPACAPASCLVCQCDPGSGRQLCNRGRRARRVACLSGCLPGRRRPRNFAKALYCSLFWHRSRAQPSPGCAAHGPRGRGRPRRIGFRK